MQLGVSSYSFSQLVNTGAMDQLEVIPKAKEMGFDVIEFSTFHLPEGETALSYAPKVRSRCEEVGLKIVNYTIAADFISGSDGDLHAEIERVKEEVRVAEILGAPGMRHDASQGFPATHVGAKDFASALPRLIEACQAITDFAAERHIKTMIENHGYFCQDSSRVEQLLCGVNHSNFGLLLDIGNFMCVDEDPAQALGRLLPYTIHVHAKDFHVKGGESFPPGAGWFSSRGGRYLRGAIIGHGNVPVATCVRMLRQAHYSGVLSIEFEGIEDPIKGIGMGLEVLRRMIKEFE